MTAVDASPRNPLRTYTFRIRFEDSPVAVAGVRKVSGLSMSVQAHEIWEGGNSLHRYAQPDRATWEPITLEQGLALDGSLEAWAQACISYLETGQPTDGVAVKRNVIIEVWDPNQGTAATAGARTAAAAAAAGGAAGAAAGAAAGGAASVGAAVGAAASGSAASGAAAATPRRRDYLVVNAWVSRFQALPALDAMTNDVGLLLLELTHEGWKPYPPAPAGSGAS